MVVLVHCARCTRQGICRFLQCVRFRQLFSNFFCYFQCCLLGPNRKDPDLGRSPMGDLCLPRCKYIIARPENLGGEFGQCPWQSPRLPEVTRACQGVRCAARLCPAVPPSAYPCWTPSCLHRLVSGQPGRSAPPAWPGPLASPYAVHPKFEQPPEDYLLGADIGVAPCRCSSGAPQALCRCSATAPLAAKPMLGIS